eukprot:TRINITY_DN16167_c0_g1_i9.p1 TRINITY_DN16167_c0_g1~~TRINITY_DN16167_c0_g1_i9.p1  ORF type:complete len:116 (+),score=12.22 TRINITY_DN16167_c0_g1_i9:302-649(+)
MAKRLNEQRRAKANYATQPQVQEKPKVQSSEGIPNTHRLLSHVTLKPRSHNSLKYTHPKPDCSQRTCTTVTSHNKSCTTSLFVTLTTLLVSENWSTRLTIRTTNKIGEMHLGVIN